MKVRIVFELVGLAADLAPLNPFAPSQVRVQVQVFCSPFLHQEIDWSAKAATGGAKGENANIKSPFGRPFWTHIYNIFKMLTTFVNVFSKQCSSHAFLVYLYSFSEGFSTHFLCHVICARSDLDCTGMAQTHVLTFERPEKLQKNRADKYSDLKFIFTGF